MDETRKHYQALFEQILTTLEISASTATKLRKLLPIIEERFGNGATYRLIVEDLNAAGMSISYGVFTVTLSRIRAGRRSAQKSKAARSPAVKQVESVSLVDSPTALRSIRDMTIDLDALREEGLAARRKSRTKR